MVTLDRTPRRLHEDEAITRVQLLAPDQADQLLVKRPVRRQGSEFVR